VRRRWPAVTLVVLAFLIAVGLGVFLLLRPTGTSAEADNDDDDGTALATVTTQTLEAQVQLDGTLGYDEPTAVTIPAGTDAAALRQAEDAVETAAATLAADRTAATDGARSGKQSVSAAKSAARAARRALVAARRDKDAACAAEPAACDQAEQQVASARDQLKQARSALAAARLQAGADGHQAGARVAADEAALASAQAALADARRHASNSGVTVTAVPEPGTRVRRGERLYAIDGVTVPLLYGSLTPWRALYRGVSPGRDVRALNDNLAALGYDERLAGQREFSAATERAVRDWQRDLHAVPTGRVALGDAVYRPGAVVVTEVTATAGSAVAPGATVLSTSSTTRVVTIDLAADQQGRATVGLPVTITLPDGTTTPGTIRSVGAVAHSADTDTPNGDSGTPTIDVVVELADPKVAEGLDKAPVRVAVTTATAADAMVVPVNALLALAGGGYAVEVVDPSGSHRLVAVTTGLFDDTLGVVQVTDTDLEVGQHVVVPSS